MPDQFYQRYVPPSAPQNEVPESSSSSQPGFYKRFIPPSTSQPTADLGSSQTQAAEESIPEGTKDEKRKGGRPHRVKKSGKKSTDASETVETVEDDGVDPAEVKHMSIREKFRRSLAGAESQRKRDATPVESGEAPEVVKHGLEPIPQPMDVEEEPIEIATPLPEWMKKPLRVSADRRMDMESLGISSGTLQMLKKRGYTQAFAIQTAVVPLTIPGRQRYNGDICVSASTGSGKTLSYVLPMVENFRGRPGRGLCGLIVVPTRELVNQVKETLETCAANSSLKIGIAVGNRTMADEKAALMTKIQVKGPEAPHGGRGMTEREAIDKIMASFHDDDSDDQAGLVHGNVWQYVSAVDILVCTPGRLVDHMRSTKGFTLEHVEMLAIDEADKLLGQSFQQWVEKVVAALEILPEESEAERLWRMKMRIWQTRRVQKIVLGATMTRDIEQLLSLKLKNPKLVVLEGQTNVEDAGHAQNGQTFELPTTLHEVAVTLGRADEKPLVLLRLLDELLAKTKEANGPAIQKKAKPAAQDTDTSDEEMSDSSSSASDPSESDTSPDDDQDSDVTSSSGSDSDDDNAEDKPDLQDKQPSASTRGVLIFTKSTESAMRLSRLLALLRPEWETQMGTLTKSTASSSNRRTLSSFRSGKLSILVASERASRGLDVKNLATVINYEIPTSLMDYIHRVGRTARAGQTGEALTIVAHHEGRWFWKEIGKSARLQRREKVLRREGLGKEVAEEQKNAYDVALNKLGVEARAGK